MRQKIQIVTGKAHFVHKQFYDFIKMYVCARFSLTSNTNRVQADHLPTVAPILESLIERVGKSVQPKIRLVNSSPLPISVLISLVDAHYKSYQNVQVIRVGLHHYSVSQPLTF